MKSLSVKLGVVLIGLFILGNAEVWGADWKPFNVTENFLCYFDASSITRPSKNIVRVWTRKSYTEKGVIGWAGKFGKEYENLSRIIELMEINCVEKKFHLISSTAYDNKGVVIKSDSSPPEWDFIIPESIAESLYKEVCK